MTQYLESLENGATLLMEGPKGRLAYEGFGNFMILKKLHRKTRIGMVAGGTGITPCF
jgi:ferredoxin-NADP reductase